MIDTTLRKGRVGTIRASKPSIDRLRNTALAGAGVAGQRLAPTRVRARVWLLACAVVALGTAGAVASQAHKHASAQPRKAAQVEHHRGGSASAAKRSAAARRGEGKGKGKSKSTAHTIPLPVSRPA